MKIITEYWAKPIPIYRFDWSARRDGDEPDDNGFMLCGYGATEQEAIDDLMQQIADETSYHECEEHGTEHMKDGRCTECEREDSCTCRMSSVNSASIDPPYLIRDQWCPVHGRDPDAELDRRRDDAMERDR
jgi:hypothetical protein